jgi:hypothetical protein
MIYRTCATRLYPSHNSWFDHSNNVWWEAEVMKLHNAQDSPAYSCFLPSSPVLFTLPFLMIYVFSHNLRDQVCRNTEQWSCSIPYFNLRDFREQRRTKETLNWLAANVHRISKSKKMKLFLCLVKNRAVKPYAYISSLHGAKQEPG